jgi:ribosome-associated toxin RatA of RatAB toxin-antitoxin module
MYYFLKDNIIMERLSKEHNSRVALKDTEEALSEYAHKGIFHVLKIEIGLIKCN